MPRILGSDIDECQTRAAVGWTCICRLIVEYLMYTCGQAEVGKDKRGGNIGDVKR
jgi:hypothetical protein